MTRVPRHVPLARPVPVFVVVVQLVAGVLAARIVEFPRHHEVAVVAFVADYRVEFFFVRDEVFAPDSVVAVDGHAAGG